MSWNSYVNNNLVGSKNVKKAAILNLDGNTRASSPGFTVSVNEGEKLVAAFRIPNSVRAAGLFIGGVKYFVLNADDRSIYGKYMGGGVACVKTLNSVIVGVYDETIESGQCSSTAEKLADYFIDQGY